MERIIGFGRGLATALRTPPGRATQGRPSPADKPDDGLRVVGRFTVPEFRSLAHRFESRGIRFTPVFDTSPPDENIDGGFYERSVVALFVEEPEVEVAARVFQEWQEQVGHLGLSHADPTTRDQSGP